MTVEVNTNDYQFSNGKQPRGVGNWAFFFERHADVADAFFFWGHYADAKNAAVDEAKRRGKRTVFVGS